MAACPTLGHTRSINSPIIRPALTTSRFTVTTKSLPQCLSPSPSPRPGRSVCSPCVSFPFDTPRRAQDLGKSSNDLLSRDFPFHGVTLEVKTNTPSNVAFKVGGTRDGKSAAITGDLEGKYVDRKHGLVFTQAWTTSNILRTQVELENQIAKGLKLDLNAALTPDSGSKSALFTTTYKQPGLHSRAFLDLFKVRVSRVLFMYSGPLTRI